MTMITKKVGRLRNAESKGDNFGPLTTSRVYVGVHKEIFLLTH